MSVQAVLRILNGPQKGERLVFEEAREHQVGRKRECDLPVTDGYMSRVHFRITADGDAFIVEDLGSSHGTLLNGRKLAGKTVLQDGDLIRAGQTDFVFQSGTEVRALGTSSKTVIGAPRTMFEPVQSSGDSVFASPRSDKDPETAAAPLSPAQLAAMGAQPRDEGEDISSEDRSEVSEAPGMTSAAESAPASESEPAAAAPDTSLSRSAFEELIAKKEVSNISEDDSDSKDDSSEDEWTSAWGDAPQPAKSEPSSESRQQSSDSQSSGPDRKNAGGQEDDLDWWPA